MSRAHGLSVKSRPAARLAILRLEDRIVPATAPDAVIRWHTIALDAQKNDVVVGQAPEQGGPTRAARALAIIQTSVYDTVTSFLGTYTPYKFHVTPAPGASINAAVAQAAHDTLVALYPSQQAAFDSALADELASISSPAATAGTAVGASVAAQMLALRANDGSALTPPPYTPGTGPFDWQPDPLHPAQTAFGSDWGFITPFFMNAGPQFRPSGPPAPGTPEYRAAFEEVKSLGGDGTTTSTTRSAEQTEIGIYWGYDGQPGLGTPPRLYNQIVAQIALERGNTLIQNARLLALVNLAQAEAGISSWETKYTYNYARPVTLIRAGDLDGDPETDGDPNWAPLGAPADNGNGTNFTPPFPAYTSGHATFGGAVFETLRRFYGTDNIAFTFVSDEFNGQTVDQNGQVRPVVTRHFDTLSEAEEENGQSRIYLGIHWEFDKSFGIQEGNQVADYLFENHLRANPARTKFTVGADASGGPRVRVIGTNGETLHDFFAFEPSFRGGVRVAQGDVTGDGVPDIVAASGAGITTRVKVFDGVTFAVVRDIAAFEAGFTGGCYIAAGDLNGDGKADLIISAGESGGPRVRAVSGADGTKLLDYFAFDPSFRGGARVAVGDIDGDGRAEIIATPGVGGNPVVREFSSAGALIREFQAYAPGFLGGVFVAAGDCDGDGKAEIITGAGAGGGPHVRVFTAAGQSIQSYYAFTPAPQLTTNGVRVGCQDVDGDGRSDIITACGPGDAPVIECRDANDLTELQRINAFEPNFLGGVTV